MTGLAPAIAIKRKIVKLKHKYPPEEVLPEDGLYHYLYQPGEEHGDQRQRATDLNWSKDTYRLDQIVEEPGNRVMYYLKDGPERAFVCELMLDTRGYRTTSRVPEKLVNRSSFLRVSLYSRKEGK